MDLGGRLNSGQQRISAVQTSSPIQTKTPMLVVDCEYYVECPSMFPRPLYYADAAALDHTLSPTYVSLCRWASLPCPLLRV
jgi:hypothetical protein